MKSRYCYFIAIIIICIAISSNANEQSISVTRNLISMPLAFTKNHGQWDDEVLFKANAGGATMWFTKDGAVYQFTRTIESKDSNSVSVVDKRFGMMPDLMEDRQPDSIETMMIKANFVGTNMNPQMIGIDMMEYKCNYFIGNDPNNWHTDVANYSAVMYEEIYDGIDLKYYGNDEQMEYDFIISPSSDYSQIKIKYEGAKSLSVNTAGELVIETMWCEVVEQCPVIYQIENDSRVPVEGIYKLQGNSSFGFELSSDYNPALPLVIDPVLSYSTYLGGSGHDQGNSIAVDATGSAYITGYTGSANLPMLNPYQGSYQGGNDVFITKLSSSGNSLVYSTFIGGSDYDYGNGISVDASGVAYITGHTSSTDFPTHNPYQGTFQGGIDVFIIKLSSSGNSLVYSTFIGGSDYDYCNGISVDDSGAAYVTGATQSTDFPTHNPYQGTFQGGYDVFVTKLSSSGGMAYSTYLGGTDNDNGYGIAIDDSGAAYVMGETYSTDFPTFNPYQGTNHGYYDVFITKLSSSGNSLVYSTYLGGNNGDDHGRGIAIDDSGAAYVTGATQSTDFPTLNPYQVIFQGGYDVFVTKLSSSGGMAYSTYLGGSDYDHGFDIAIDASGAVYVTGRTQSTNFPTFNPYQGIFQGYPYDVFVTKLSSSGNSLVYSTYLGGSNWEEGLSIAVDASGTAYVTGYMESTDFPIFNPYQETFQGGHLDAFVTKFSNDSDGDEINDTDDNCPSIYNPDQLDSDSDEVGDVCDNCPDSVNTDQLDTDGDTIGDICDNCPDEINTNQSDIDSDSFGDVCDNCPDSSNVNQSDIDDDTIGDVCDNCPNDPNPDQLDTNSDNIGDVCCCQLRGDVAPPPDGIVLVNDIVWLVDFLFRGGTAPECWDEGDCAIPLDGDVLVNDVVWLVDYLFKGGTAPPEC